MIKKQLLQLLLFLSATGLAAQIQLGNTLVGENNGDSSGTSVAINDNGTIAAVGAPSAISAIVSGIAQRGGHVRVYGFNGTVWTAGFDFDAEANLDNFGVSVAMSNDGSIIACGAPRGGGGDGYVHVYQAQGHPEAPTGYIRYGNDVDGDSGSVNFGTSIALNNNGTRMVVGGLNYVRVYENNNFATPWVQVGQTLESTVASDNFGVSVGMDASGNRIIVGNPLDDTAGTNAGYARVYEFNGTFWVQVGQDIQDSSGDNAGGAVDISNNGQRVAVGFPGDDGNGTNAGAVRMYDFNGTSWGQVGSDILGALNSTNLGGSGAVDREGAIHLNGDGTSIVVGSGRAGIANPPGYVERYRLKPFSGAWIRTGSTINGVNANDQFGFSVASNSEGSIIIGGARFADDNGSNSGHARVFEKVGTTTYTIAGGWDSGIPDNTLTAVVAENYDTADPGLGDINACDLIVATGATLSVNDGNFINIDNNITVNGTLNVANTGSVVQNSSQSLVINNGSIAVSKTTPSLNPRDFILLSSPMSTETRSGVYNSADRVFGIISGNFIPNTDPALSGVVANFIDDNGDYLDNTISNLDVGSGYLVFPQAITATAPVNYTHTYTQGTLNNGSIAVPTIYNGPATENNFNLLGNPYPSAIDTDLLIQLNPNIDAVYFWEHITPPNQNLPGFGNSNFSMDDVSLRNLMGGTASVNGGTVPGQFMASGQGFAILADQASSGTDLIFNNGMRVTGNNNALRSPTITPNRLWLRLDSETYTLSSSALIGFTENATATMDHGYDSQRLHTTTSLFSTLETGDLYHTD